MKYIMANLLNIQFLLNIEQTENNTIIILSYKSARKIYKNVVFDCAPLNENQSNGLVASMKSNPHVEYYHRIH